MVAFSSTTMESETSPNKHLLLPSNSSLRALSSLEPPSPILSIGDLAPCTLEEIQSSILSHLDSVVFLSQSEESMHQRSDPLMNEPRNLERPSPSVSGDRTTGGHNADLCDYVSDARFRPFQEDDGSRLPPCACYMCNSARDVETVTRRRDRNPDTDSQETAVSSGSSPSVPKPANFEYINSSPIVHSPLSNHACRPQERDIERRCHEESLMSNTSLRLPEDLEWLRSTVVEAVIDQEGFRAAHARFRLTGFSEPNLPARTDPFHSNGMAEFTSVSRQTFHFHYAPLDGLPILRRITVDGDESRDFTSRQATLALKANGVYTVRGNETLSFFVSHRNTVFGSIRPHDLPKLHWRFDYLVDDRRNEGTGKRLEGEKVLTPLTFSCSPFLLHPLQARRISLMHVLKKTVTSNILAQKMEPPDVKDRMNFPSSSAGFHNMIHRKQVTQDACIAGQTIRTSRLLSDQATGMTLGEAYTSSSHQPVPRGFPAHLRRASSASDGHHFT